MRLASEVASAYLAGAVDGLSAAVSLIGASGVSVIPQNLTAGSFVQLGSWGGEDITWRVLDVSGGRALVIAEKVLDCARYNDSPAEVIWEGCSLRRWLNGFFLEGAFDASERAIIASSRVENPDNALYGTRGCAATSDRVFCLSTGEAKRYFSGDADRVAYPTAHARGNGVWVNRGAGGSHWWLRSHQRDHAYGMDFIDRSHSRNGRLLRRGVVD